MFFSSFTRFGFVFSFIFRYRISAPGFTTREAPLHGLVVVRGPGEHPSPPRTGTAEPLQPLGGAAVELPVPGCARADGREPASGWWLLAALLTWLCSVFETLGFVSQFDFSVFITFT